mgnify:CR=1 FL=1
MRITSSIAVLSLLSLAEIAESHKLASNEAPPNAHFIKTMEAKIHEAELMAEDDGLPLDEHLHMYL